MTYPDDFGRHRNEQPGAGHFPTPGGPNGPDNHEEGLPYMEPPVSDDLDNTGPQRVVVDEASSATPPHAGPSDTARPGERQPSATSGDQQRRTGPPQQGYQPPPLPNSGPQGFSPESERSPYRPPLPPRQGQPDPQSSFPPPVESSQYIDQQRAQPVYDPHEETTVFPTWRAAPTPSQPAPQPTGPTGNDQSLFGPDAAFGDIRQDTIEPPAKHVAQKGWRKTVRLMSGGLVKPGPGPKEESAAQRLEKIRSPLGGVHKIAVLSVKGGVGKTTTTVGVGSAIARTRGDRVIATDLDADLGDLSDRFHDAGGPTANIQYLAQRVNIQSYADVRAHTVQNVDRLEALSSQNDPNSDYVLSGKDYQAAMRILERHYNVILCDCGTSVTTPLFSTVASDVGGLVIVAAQNMTGVRGARNTLAWLQAHGFGQLLTRTVVVLNAPYPGSPLVDLDVYGRYFRERGTQVVNVPFDPHLAEGAAIEFASLKKATSEAFLEVAGYIADHYPLRHASHGSHNPGSF
ncbi:chromosome partitioning protein ParA [Mycobacterium sp. DBP42]|nr:chromosome partitioning protein ParA [Mycobacterium sp. DBP42]